MTIKENMNILKLKYLVLSFCAMTSLAFVSCDKNSHSDDDIIAINKENKEKGETFLAENRNAEGVVETFSGLQYRIDSLGSGEKPILTDSVKLEYVGKKTNGEIFVSNTDMLLVSAQIDGLAQGLRYMPEGSKFTLYIPYYLGYGVGGRSFSSKGKTVNIGAYSALIFECELHSVKHNK